MTMPEPDDDLVEDNAKREAELALEEDRLHEAHLEEAIRMTWYEPLP